MSRLNRLVSEVLLAGAGSFPGLAFDYGVVMKLLNKFFTHYFSTGVIKQGLQVRQGLAAWVGLAWHYDQAPNNIYWAVLSAWVLLLWP